MTTHLPSELNAAAWIINDSTRRYPDRHAVLDEHGSLTFDELSDQIDRMGRGLREVGCKAGERVLIALSDSPKLIITLLGSMKIGAIPVPVSPSTSAADYEYYLNETTPRFAVVEASEFMKASNRTSTTAVLCGADENHDALSWETLVRHQGPTPLEPEIGDGRRLALLLYTSGSTNRQKCVMHSHNSIAIACRNVGVEAFSFTHTDRILSVPKPFFAFGLGFGVFFPLYVGASTITGPARVDVTQICDLIDKYRPTALCAIPTFLSVLLQAKAWRKVDLSSVRFIVSAGEPLSRLVAEIYRSDFGIEVLDGIGSTEMLTHFISNTPGNNSLGTCGTPVPGFEITLTNVHGSPVSDGEIGTLTVNGPTALLGYWNKPEATLCGDAIRTGDNLYRDASGFYHYCGRSDDMLKVGGLWVVPQEVESALREHPAISEAVVTTREDPSGKRRLVAYLVTKTEFLITPQSLLQFVSSKLPTYMTPAAFVVLPAIPHTVNGKLDRGALPQPDWKPALASKARS